MWEQNPPIPTLLPWLGQHLPWEQLWQERGSPCPFLPQGWAGPSTQISQSACGLGAGSGSQGPSGMDGTFRLPLSPLPWLGTG